MTRTSQRLLALYLTSLLALAALGAHNQLRYNHHEALLVQKGSLQRQLATLRQDAAGISGALAIRNWAVSRGMIAAPEALNIGEIGAASAPETLLPQGELEMYTLWR